MSSTTYIRFANYSYYNHYCMVSNLQILSASQQLARYIRDKIRLREWVGEMPGEDWMVREFQIGRQTVRSALGILEREGLVVSQGPGKKRLIKNKELERPENFCVTLLLHDHDYDRATQLLLPRLAELGYRVDFAPKSMMELEMNSDRIIRMAQKVTTDAWVVISAPREVLDWFASGDTPSFALYGRWTPKPMAAIGPDSLPAFRTAIRRLHELGHQRIVMILPEHMRKPEPSQMLTSILDEMESLGIQTGAYNVPDWQQGKAGLRECLDSIFALTPPTAIFVTELYEYHEVRLYLAERGLEVPRDVSLICRTSPGNIHSSYAKFSHFGHSTQPLLRRVLEWLHHAARGVDDHKRSFTKSRFIEGDTTAQSP